MTRLRLEPLDDRTLPSAGVPGLLAVGADAGGLPEVRLLDDAGTLLRTFLAYDETFRGGVRTAVGDVTGDGVADIVTAPGVGGGPVVKVFDGVTTNLVRSFSAYDDAFRGGVNLAVGRVDGRAVIVTGPGLGGGPHVKVFDALSGRVLTNILAYDDGFLGGVSVGLGEVLNDGRTQVVTGAGPGGAPHVRVFDAVTAADRGGFLAFDRSFTGGVTVTAGDVGNLGYDAVVVGAGPGGGPLVNVFDAANNIQLSGYFAYDPTFRGGVNVGIIAGDATTPARIITAAGPTGGPHVQIFNTTVNNNFFGYNQFGGFGGWGYGGLGYYNPFGFYAFPSFFGGGAAFGTGLGLFGAYAPLYAPICGPDWFFSNYYQPVYVFDGAFVEPYRYEYDPSYQYIDPYGYDDGYYYDESGAQYYDGGYYDDGSGYYDDGGYYYDDGSGYYDDGYYYDDYGDGGYYDPGYFYDDPYYDDGYADYGYSDYGYGGDYGW